MSLLHLFFVALLFAFPQGSQGFVAVSNGLVCETIADTTSFDVCAIVYSEGPSPAVAEVINDKNETTTTTMYMGNYIHDFLIYNSFDGAEGTSQLEVEVQHHGGYNIRVERNGTDDECLVVAINKLACNSCTFCASTATDGDTYSADCTNHPFGRKVVCESTAKVFFPLTAKALEKKEEVPVDTPSVETTPPPPTTTTTTTVGAGDDTNKDSDNNASSATATTVWTVAAIVPTVIMSILL